MEFQPPPPTKRSRLAHRRHKRRMAKLTLFAYLVGLLSETSTYRGIALLLMALGIKISPEMLNQIMALGLSIAGTFGVVFRDRLASFKEKEAQIRSTIYSLEELYVRQNSRRLDKHQ